MKKYNSSNRSAIWDGCRSYLIMCVVILHSSLAYMSSGNYTWVVTDTSKNIIFDCISRIFDICLMPCLFFIAGYYTLYSMSSTTFYAYYFKRIKRLLLPFILGTFTLCPIVEYINLLDKSSNVPNYFSFWFFDFILAGATSRHLWFIFLLFIFQCLSILFFKWSHSGLKNNKNNLTAVFMINVVFIFLMAIFSYSIGDTTWFNFIGKGIIRFQPSRGIAYLAFFISGLLLYPNLKQYMS